MSSFMGGASQGSRRLAYCDLPKFAGMTLTDERRLALAASTATAEIEARTAQFVRERLTNLEAELEQRGASPTTTSLMQSDDVIDEPCVQGRPTKGTKIPSRSHRIPQSS
jgi:hypothetical protein